MSILSKSRECLPRGSSCEAEKKKGVLPRSLFSVQIANVTVGKLESTKAKRYSWEEWEAQHSKFQRSHNTENMKIIWASYGSTSAAAALQTVVLLYWADGQPAPA